MAEPLDTERILGAKVDGVDHKLYAAHVNWGCKLLQNKSGGALASGVAVIPDTTADEGFTTTTTEGFEGLVGVIEQEIDWAGTPLVETADPVSVADDAWGWVRFLGPVAADLVTLDADCSRYEYLKHDGVAGQFTPTGVLATSNAAIPAGACAVALQAATGAPRQPSVWMLGFTQGSSATIDAATVTYTPADNDDFGGADPGATADALDYLAAHNWVLIGRTELSVAAASISITSIPAYYESLLVVGRIRPVNDGVNPMVQVNGDAGNNYNTVGGTGVASYYLVAANGNDANYAAAFHLFLPGYAEATLYKPAAGMCVLHSTAATPAVSVGAAGGIWLNAAAINRVDLLFSAGNVDAGSTVSIYGLPR